jgi:hypothetical protein
LEVKQWKISQNWVARVILTWLWPRFLCLHEFAYLHMKAYFMVIFRLYCGSDEKLFILTYAPTYYQSMWLNILIQNPIQKELFCTSWCQFDANSILKVHSSFGVRPDLFKGNTRTYKRQRQWLLQNHCTWQQFFYRDMSVCRPFNFLNLGTPCNFPEVYFGLFFCSADDLFAIWLLAQIRSF